MTVLVKLRSSSFDTTSYTNSMDKYRRVKPHFVAEKRKVLRALAGSKAKDVASNPVVPSSCCHAKACVAKSSCGSKQRRRPGTNKKSEQVPVVRCRRACDDEYQEAEQTLVCVKIADNKEHGCDKNADMVVKAKQPSDIAFTLASSNQKVRCAEHVKTVIEETERASVVF